MSFLNRNIRKYAAFEPELLDIRELCSNQNLKKYAIIEPEPVRRQSEEVVDSES